MAAPVARRCQKNDKSINLVIDSEFSTHQQTHLSALSNAVIQINPSLAAFYRLKMLKEDAARQTNSPATYKQCAFCGIAFLPDNHRVRLLPRQRFTPRIKRLVQRHTDDPGTLGQFQQKLVAQYHSGCNRVSVTCFSCKKTSKLVGQSREQRQKQLEDLNTPSTVTEEYPKTRKDKKKERRKLMKKMKKVRGDEADVHAGLTLGKHADADSIHSDKGHSSLTADKTLKIDPVRDLPPPPSSASKQSVSGQGSDDRTNVSSSSANVGRSANVGSSANVSSSSANIRRSLSRNQTDLTVDTSKQVAYSPVSEKVGKRLGHAASVKGGKQSEPITSSMHNTTGPIRGKLSSGPITGQVNDPGKPITGQVNSLGKPITGQVNDPGKPITGQVNSPGKPITGQVNDPGKPITGQVNSAGKPITGQVNSAGKPITGQVNSAGKPITGQVNSAGKPITGQVNSPGKPITGQVNYPGKPITGQVNSPGKPITGQVNSPGKPITGQVNSPGKPITGQVNDPGKPITGQVNDPGKPITGQVNSPGKPITGKQTNQSNLITGRVNKQAGRKNKAKKLSQQLGNMLKEEKKKKSGEATLADFLSSL